MRMRICLCRLFKVVKSSSGTGSVDTAFNIIPITLHAVHTYISIHVHIVSTGPHSWPACNEVGTDVSSRVSAERSRRVKNDL